VSKTLFWYIFRDLVRIFLMASGALAGIMSFGGLLRPLTENGLDAGQVSKMLTFFMPAMTTYSFPVAALFATTMVYGRLSADNELTACRAGGISFLSLTTPALVLGLLVSLISLLFLCFIVPIFTLKVEQVVYSNLAQLVQNQIERKHVIKLEKFNVYAQTARVLPPEVGEAEGSATQPESKRKRGEGGVEQRVELVAPMIVSYVTVDPEGFGGDPNQRLQIATEFWMAKRAVAYIHQKGEKVDLTVVLENASKFARNTATTKPAVEYTVRSTQFGPVPMSSPIDEDPKFMTIDALKAMFYSPETSKRLQDQLQALIREEEASEYLQRINKALQEKGRYDFVTDAEIVTLTPGDLAGDLRKNDGELVLQSKPRPEARQVKVTVKTPEGQVKSVDEAMEMRVKATPRWETNTPDEDVTLDVEIEGYDVVIQREEETARHRKFSRLVLDLPMPADLKALRKNTANYYLERGRLSRTRNAALAHEQYRLLSKLQSEIHSRSSFAISCLVLVLTGCALGMMFRSSNFLSAFAVSFIPAILCIVLIVTGQQICNHANKGLGLGLGFIWSGNAIVLALAVTLIGKLQRT
jgi:lipopolysaccharide export LptBFGC system permease protein LptF